MADIGETIREVEIIPASEPAQNPLQEPITVPAETPERELEPV